MANKQFGYPFGQSTQEVREGCEGKTQRTIGASDLAVGQNQWDHFGVGAPPILVYFSGDWDVHWG